MKKLFRKGISFVLALAMIITLLPMTTFAEGEASMEDATGSGDYLVTGAYVLSGDLTVPDGGSITFADGATLTVADGVTLTYQGYASASDLPEKGKLIVNGTLGVVENLYIGNETTLEAMIDQLDGTGSVWSKSSIDNIHDNVVRIQRCSCGQAVYAYGDWEYHQLSSEGMTSVHKYIGASDTVKINVGDIGGYSTYPPYVIESGAFVDTAAKTIYLTSLTGETVPDDAFDDTQTVYCDNNVYSGSNFTTNVTGQNYSLRKQDYQVKFTFDDGYEMQSVSVQRYWQDIDSCCILMMLRREF